MTYVSGDGQYSYRVAVDDLARDLAGILPGAVATCRDAWRATLAVDGVSVAMQADSYEGLVRGRLLPEGVDFRVVGAYSPVEDDIDVKLDPRPALTDIAAALMREIERAKPLLDAQRAFAARRKRVSDGAGEWMGVLRVGGLPVRFRPGGYWDWYVASEEERYGASFVADHDPNNRAGETLFFEMVQWFMGRGDNPHFTRPFTPDEMARADCLVSRVIQTERERGAADRAMADGRQAEWIKAVPLPAPSEAPARRGPRLP